MDKNKILDVEITDDVGRFAETYSSFNKVINRLQRQYLSIKETSAKQSEELQIVNEQLQSLMDENRQVTEFLNSILNALSSGVITIDTSGNIQHMNPAAYRILGIDRNNDFGSDSKYADIMISPDNENISAMAAISRGQNNLTGTKKVTTRFGGHLELSVSVSILMDKNGQIAGAVELFSDITKLRAIEDQLAQMKVLASLGEMAATIAHEVRNPLVGVGGFASLLVRDLENDPPKKEMARKIVEGVQSINAIIQALVEFSRKEKLEKTKVNLNSYLKNIIDVLLKENGYAEKAANVECDLPVEQGIIVELDRCLFRQAFGNLLKNGLEAGGEVKSPRIKISSGILPLTEAQKNHAEKIELGATESLVEISIEDNGPGIAPEKLDKLFSPFHSTKENGMGLGLSIAWKIIKVHGGDILVESEKGKGTKFSIFLPIKTG